MGVEDTFSYSYALKHLDIVRGVDISMFNIKLQEDLETAYTFFSDRLYSKKWIYYIDGNEDYLSYLPSGVLCKTKDCSKRLIEGESVLLRNYNNNQYYTLYLDKEGERPNLRFFYLFKHIPEPLDEFE